jgi:hypothetical protein
MSKKTQKIIVWAGLILIAVGTLASFLAPILS